MGVVLVVVVGVVRLHLLDTGGDESHRLDVRLRGSPAPGSSPYALPAPRGPRAPPCLSPGAYVALPSLALGSPPGPQTLARAHSCPFALPPVPRIPSSVTRVLARTADAPVLPASLPVSLSMSLAVSPSADHTPLRPVRPVAARYDVLLTSLRPSSGAAARARVLPVPLPFPCAASRVSSSAARALPPSATAGLGALPVPLPSLLAACALACPLGSSLGAPPVASRPSLCAPLAGTLPRPRAVPPLLDHAPGVPLPPQLRQLAAWRRRRRRQGAGRPRPPLWEGGLGQVRLGGAGVSLAGVGVGAVLGTLSALRCGCGVAPARCTGPVVGPPPCAGGMPGATAWSAGAVARPAVAAVSAPCVPGAPSGGGAAGAAA